MWRLVLFALVMSSWLVPDPLLGNETEPVNAAWFEAQIRPLLANHCLQCHGEEKQEGNLRFDSLASMLEGGDSGPALVPGDPTASLIVEALHQESFEMPPSGPLPPEEIARFEVWILHGAPWPEHTAQIRAAAKTITEEDRDWWAFRPLAKPLVPETGNDVWSRHPLDRFVYRKLAEQGMQPAPRADRAVLVRRLYFDLLGLPPSPEEIQEFVDDSTPDAWDRLIEKLLADPRHGEHWARHWLDLVRYAESDGWNKDAYRPRIWRYRDYVVRSFNEDKPYPQFVREQLAGDELPGDDPEALAATGFLRLGIYEYNQRDARGQWNDILNEITDVTGDVFLGMGMACARCHDHKFDPILQEDYFKLRAFLEPMVWRDDLHHATAEQRAEHAAREAEWEAATVSLREEIDALIGPYHKRKWKTTVDKFPLEIQACFRKPASERNSWEQQMTYLVERQFEEEGGGPLANMSKEDRQEYERLKQALAAFDDLKPKPLPTLMAASDHAGPIAPTVIPDDPTGQPVGPGVPAVLDMPGFDLPEIQGDSTSSGRRMALATWIGQPDNPITTRVIVNRIWQHHFGEGLVPTANDFGHLGQTPSHPELLDWLAATFVEQGWSFKNLHRLILTSATWQQSSYHPQADMYQQRDPEERLLWRARVRRLSAEQIRDAMLTVTGELKASLGGPSVSRSRPRRSLYIKSFRNTPDEFLHAFDMANGLKSVATRDPTTTPTQALMMINGEYLLARAEKFAERITNSPDRTGEEVLRQGFQLAWGRPPSATELSAALRFAADADEQDAHCTNQKKLVDFCHVLLNSNPFLYVD